jgi:hypothetical protein
MPAPPEQPPNIVAIGLGLDAAVVLPANLSPGAQIVLARSIDAIRTIRDRWTSETAHTLTKNFALVIVASGFLKIRWSQCDRSNHAAVQAFRADLVAALQVCETTCTAIQAILSPLDESLRAVHSNLGALEPSLHGLVQEAYNKATGLLATYHFTHDPTDEEIIRALGPYATAEAIAAVKASLKRVKDDIQASLNAVTALQDTAGYVLSATDLLTVTMGNLDNLLNASQTAQTAAKDAEDIDDDLLVMELDGIFKNQIPQMITLCTQEIGDDSNPTPP